MACVAPALSSSSWAHALPYLDRPLGPASATWNTKFPTASPAELYALLPAPTPPKQRPVLSLPALASDLPARRFDPFADDPVASTSKGRRRAPSFSAGYPRSGSTFTILLSTPVPPPPAAAPAPPVAGAPTPFHARHYPTPDARTLLNRIHAVGRPRSPYAYASLSSPYSRSASPYAGGGGLCNSYESECGARGYVPSRLSECVAAC
ncbi:hypothetical protein B0H17DRAFT_1182994 [Mycena rosella]|uniref:Uncharacterized protein n=1 Tax=Mycena rosella TaxID=1033263 RepID=A0AAD7G7H0_MYCRO|nr:hypothetical protein B0H17DRAFT_1182994 [Mycena rosella]